MMKYLVTFVRKDSDKELRIIKEGTEKLIRWIRKYADDCSSVRILTVEGT